MRYVEIYVFACGHGDTLLIRLPDDRWVLVDCYLPKQDGTRKRFFEFVCPEEIQHLAAVFQTHPDYDHFLGMRAVLTHFIEETDKSVGKYVDSGLNAQQIRHLLVDPKRPASKEYQKLQNALRTWRDEGKIDWCELDAERPPFSPKGLAGQIDFLPIAPDAQLKRRLIESSIERIGQQATAKLEAKKLSPVLALVVNGQNARFNVLLSADADTDSIKRALDLWHAHADERKIARCFDVVKVSHHGSFNNHCQELCIHGHHPQHVTKIAAISAGERAALPDRRVIEEYQKAGWTVMVTTIRKTAQTNRAVDIHFKPANPTAFYENTIELLWQNNGTFRFQPSASVVGSADTSSYQTARS